MKRSDPDYRAKMAEQARKRWQDPTYRARMESLWQDPDYQRSQAARSRELWQTPDHRKRHIDAMNTPYHFFRMSVKARRQWAENTAYRLKMMSLAKTPERRARQSEIARRIDSVRYLNNWWKNPTNRIWQSDRLRKLWQDPNYRYMISMVKTHYRDPVFRKQASEKTRRNSKLRKIALHLLPSDLLNQLIKDHPKNYFTILADIAERLLTPEVLAALKEEGIEL